MSPAGPTRVPKVDETTEPAQEDPLTPPTEAVGRASSETPTVDDVAAAGADTETWESRPAGAPQPTSRGDPSAIGRYRVINRLSQGGFGRVYLASDDDLERLVAVKVLNPQQVGGPEDVETYLAEARTLAKLDHPNIVPVYDVGRADDGLCYIVSKYVQGSDLRDLIRHARPTSRESAELVATVAEALHHAHTRGLVHRDVKPANILIDASGKPCVADFGLALRDEDYGKGVTLAGTPAYMSPEQARSEGHRVDGRSDIFSLGVVFYELLTGRKPFRGGSTTEIMDQVSRFMERPPRQVDDSIPRELERICLKALSKRVNDRYTTARDLSDDLRAFLKSTAAEVAPTITALPVILPASGSAVEATPVSGSPNRADPDRRPVPIVPKGLRSFDEHDADFFLELVPGPRDRNGLPESLRFWKTRIEAVDPEETFEVGLIYGPSGCGKSSLVKAGLLPRIAGHVVQVYVESTPEETESRLLRGLRKSCPDLSDTLGLVDSVAALRRGRVVDRGRKVLVVLDQFEQWLFTRRAERDSELVAALRHCDGVAVQCVVMVRADFGMAAMRFMNELEIPVIEGKNYATVDRFDRSHAEKVLTLFGRAYGRFTADGPLNAVESRFVAEAVLGMSEDGMVDSIRLALFAQMFRGKAWTPASLKEVGGAEGIGVAFLEEAFEASSSRPQYRIHEQAARGVLKSLLPENLTDIKGRMRSQGELLAASGYAGRPRDFADLMRELRSELRLIMPAEPASGPTAGHSAPPDDSGLGGDRYYQLTHDYLVPSIRKWLTRKQRETRRGRAAILLEDRAALWVARPERRLLPTFLEWATITLLVRPNDRTQSQSRMMRASLVLLLAISLVVSRMERDHQVARVGTLTAQLRVAEMDHVPGLVRELSASPVPWQDRLDAIARDASATLPERTRACLALVRHDSSCVPFLRDRLLEAGPREHAVIRAALEPWKAQTLDSLWGIATDTEAAPGKRLRAAAALALYDPVRGRWREIAPDVAMALVAESLLDIRAWAGLLQPARRWFREPLVNIFADRAPERASAWMAATSLLADIGKDDPDFIIELAKDANDRQYQVFFPALAGDRRRALLAMRQELAAPVPETTEGRDRLAKRRSNAAVSLMRLGEPAPVWPLLVASPDPRVRTRLIDQMLRFGVEPRLLIEHLAEEHDPVARQALLLALGDLPPARVPAGLVEEVVSLHATDTSAAVHSGTEWLMRRWGHDERLRESTAALVGTAHGGWSVNGQGQTMFRIAGPVRFRMGPTATHTRRMPDETTHERRIGRSFAVSAHEVTVAQFREYYRDLAYDKYVSPDPDGPIINVDWYEAMRYCRWLSDQEKVPKDQMCYPPIDQIGPRMEFPKDLLQRTGYRLPTEAEWEYVCGAGTTTRWSFDESEALLPAYAWIITNSSGRVHPVGRLKPNPFGFFDLHGNVDEWCQTLHSPYRATAPGEFVEDDEIGAPADGNLLREIRGGYYREIAMSSRTSARAGLEGNTQYSFTGLRVAQTLPH